MASPVLELDDLQITFQLCVPVHVFRSRTLQVNFTILSPAQKWKDAEALVKFGSVSWSQSAASSVCVAD